MKNQKGSAVVWTIVVIAIFVIIGAIYFYSRNNSTATPIQSTSTNSNSSLDTYTDSENNFSIEYPSTLYLQTSNFEMWGDNFSEQPADPSAEELVYASSGPETLSISESPDPADVGNCMVIPQFEGTSTASTVELNGVPFLTYGRGDVAMGQIESVNFYRTIRNNVCWTISKSIRSEADDRLSSQEITEQDEAIAAASAQLDPVVQSFKFLSDTGGNMKPPTCTLKTDKSFYSLGDVINLTWKSYGADRAVWNQPLESTGLRKSIVPPTGTPSLNGSTSTVANIEGYQPITLQVASSEGFGTCSVSVQVNPSSAVPSITIDSATIEGSTLYGGSNVAVTISGTATNGALYNDGVNIVLVDPSYYGSFDEASVYQYPDRNPAFLSGGAIVDLRQDSVPFENWSVSSYAPARMKSVRVLAYPFYSSSVSSPTKPLANVVINLAQ